MIIKSVDCDVCHSEGHRCEQTAVLSHMALLSPVLPALLLFLTCPKLWHAVCVCMYKQALYKSKAKDLLKSGCNELLRPDILTALYSTVMGSKVNVH